MLLLFVSCQTLIWGLNRLWVSLGVVALLFCSGPFGMSLGNSSTAIQADLGSLDTA